MDASNTIESLTLSWSINRSMSSPALNLDILPSDIIRKIVRVGQESINNIKLISRRWNNIALNHLSDRKRLPVIKKFSILNVRVPYKRIALEVQVPNKYETYFQFEKWRNCQVMRCTEYVGIRITLNERFKHTAMINLERLFSRCSIIERLEFDEHSDFCYFNSLLNTLSDVGIKEFAINQCPILLETDTSKITQFAQSHSVQILELSYSTFCWEFLKQTLLTFFSGNFNFAAITVKVITIKVETRDKPRMRKDEEQAYWNSQIEDFKSGHYSAMVKIRNWAEDYTHIILERIEN